MKRLFLGFLVIIPITGYGWSIGCSIGVSTCIISQGTKIPSQQAIEIMDYCENFTYNDLGRQALRLNFSELAERSGGHDTPLVQAWFAYDYLRNSPLAFARHKEWSQTSYRDVTRACQQLSLDFDDDAKWITWFRELNEPSSKNSRYITRGWR
ncbi:hypothetical protein [Thiocystis violacea]|uniref:hypothetical protein n=1 Tax=Thiocystis violacea TaxID=13725 RepID=UPI001905B171|nr:hypothetical protein [Thiocystis violacea]